MALRFKEIRALVADDNELCRKVMAAALESFGIAPVIAACGASAVEAAGQEAFDIIFMDCQMAGMDGLAATRRIRKAGINKDTVIIAMTGGTSAAERNACTAAGMNDYLPKPLEEEALARMLRRWIRPEKRLEDDAIDGHTIDDLRAAVRGKFGVILQELLENAEELLRRMAVAIDGGDAMALAKTAHLLKSTSGQLGATRLHLLVTEIERAALKNDMLPVRGLLLSAEEEMRQVHAALDGQAGA